MRRLRYIILLIFSVLLCMQMFCSCVDEQQYASDKSVRLKFSEDTISFDTIFTTIGSITKQVRVFNKENSPVKIDRIMLGGGASSYFRLNVDGDTSMIVRDIEIGAKDSIFIFVRVELDVNNQNNPLLVEDSIVLDFNGKTQCVQLMAYGQDAYYHKPLHTLGQGAGATHYSLVNEGGEAAGVQVSGSTITWKTDKPHVVLGACVVDSAFVLNLQSDTKIYMGNGAEFWVYTDGTLQAQGTNTQPIIFTSLRTQDRYNSLPGQWGGIWLWAGSKDNIMDNVIVKNATIGLMADSCVTANPTLKISDSFIENCSALGLYSRGATIYGENVVVQNTGSYTVALTLGGEYQFVGCTFANYWSYDNTRRNATLLLNDWYEAVDHSIQLRPITKADFYNSVIYGSSAEEEIEFDLVEGGGSRYFFSHCLIKTKTFNNSTPYADNCIFNLDPKFVDVSSNDLHPTVSSPLIGNGDGIWNLSIPFDIYGVLRKDPPCIGAIEYNAALEPRITKRH